MGWWRWALISPDGVAPSRMVDVSASVSLPLHHKVQRLSSGTNSPGWSRKKGRKTVVVCGCGNSVTNHSLWLVMVLLHFLNMMVVPLHECMLSCAYTVGEP